MDDPRVRCGAVEFGDWWRDSPEAQRLLEIERRRVAALEARYECQRCGLGLEPDYALSDRLNRVRAWFWRRAHRLNCR